MSSLGCSQPKSLNLLLTSSIPFPAPCSLWALDWCPLLHSVPAEMAKPSHSENGQAKLSVSLTALPAALAISRNDIGCNLLDPTFILILSYILYLTSVTWGCLKRPFLLRPLSSSLDFFWPRCILSLGQADHSKTWVGFGSWPSSAPQCLLKLLPLPSVWPPTTCLTPPEPSHALCALHCPILESSHVVPRTWVAVLPSVQLGALFWLLLGGFRTAGFPICALPALHMFVISACVQTLV